MGIAPSKKAEAKQQWIKDVLKNCPNTSSLDEMESKVKEEILEEMVRMFYPGGHGTQAATIAHEDHQTAAKGLMAVCNAFRQTVGTGSKGNLAAGHLWTVALQGLAGNSYESTQNSNPTIPSDSDSDSDSDSNNGKGKKKKRRTKNESQHTNDSFSVSSTMGDIASEAAIDDGLIQQKEYDVFKSACTGRKSKQVAPLTSYIEEFASEDKGRGANVGRVVAKNYMSKNLYSVMQRFVVRVRRYLKGKPHTKLMTQVRPSIKEALMLSRSESKDVMPHLPSSKDKHATDHEETQQIRSNIKPSHGNILEASSRVIFITTSYKAVPMKMVSVEYSESNVLLSVSATVVGTPPPPGSFFGNQGTGNVGDIITYSRTNRQISQYEMPSHVSVPYFNKGNTGMGATLPLEHVFKTMYDAGTLKSINGVIHMNYVGDGANSTRSRKNRFNNSTIIAVTPMSDGYLVRSVYESVVTCCYFAVDNRGTNLAHGAAHVKEWKEASAALAVHASEKEDEEITVQTHAFCDGKYLTECSSIYKWMATVMDRIYDWNHTMRYNMARSFSPLLLQRIFDAPCNRALEFDQLLRDIGNVELGKYFGVDITVEGGDLPTDYQFRRHELLHSRGRAAQQLLGVVIGAMESIGELENFERHCKDVCGISIKDGYTISNTKDDDGHKECEFQMRVGLMGALATDPRLCLMDLQDSANLPVMDLISQLCLAFRMSRTPFGFYSQDTLPAIASEFFFIANQYDTLMALVRGAISWKPTSMHFTFRYQDWLFYCVDNDLDASLIDSSVIEILHNYTWDSAIDVGGGGGTGCTYNNFAKAAGEVVADSFQRYLEMRIDVQKRHDSSVKRKDRLCPRLRAQYVADRKMIEAHLCRGEGLLSVASRSKHNTYFQSALQEITENVEMGAEEYADLLNEMIDMHPSDDEQNEEDDQNENQVENEVQDEEDRTAEKVLKYARNRAKTSAAAQSAQIERRAQERKIEVDKMTFLCVGGDFTVPLPFPDDLPERGWDPQSAVIFSRTFQSSDIRFGITKGSSNAFSIEINHKNVRFWYHNTATSTITFYLKHPVSKLWIGNSHKESIDPTGGFLRQCYAVEVNYIKSEDKDLDESESVIKWIQQTTDLEPRYIDTRLANVNALDAAISSVEEVKFDVIASNGDDLAPDPETTEIHELAITKGRLMRLGSLVGPPNSVVLSWIACKSQICDEDGLLLVCPFTDHPLDAPHGCYRRKGYRGGRPTKVSIHPVTGIMNVVDAHGLPISQGDHFQCSGRFRMGENPPAALLDDVVALLDRIDERGWDGSENTSGTHEAFVRAATVGGRMANGDRRHRVARVQQMVNESSSSEDDSDSDDDSECEWENCEKKALNNDILNGFCSFHIKACLVEIIKYVENMTTLSTNLQKVLDVVSDYASKQRKSGPLKFGAVNHRKMYVKLLHALRMEKLVKYLNKEDV